MQYFKVRNWERYQRYDRNKVAPPPWIRVYTSTLTDPQTALLSDARFGQLVRLWTVACLQQNRLPFHDGMVRKMTGCGKSLRLQHFLDAGLIELYTDCTQSVDKLYPSGGQGKAEKKRENPERAPARSKAEAGPEPPLPEDLASVDWPMLGSRSGNGGRPSDTQLRWLKEACDEVGLEVKGACEMAGVKILTGPRIGGIVKMLDQHASRHRNPFDKQTEYLPTGYAPEIEQRRRDKEEAERAENAESNPI